MEQKCLEIIRNVNLIPFKFHSTKKTVEIKRKLVTCGKTSNCLSSQGVIRTKLETDFVSFVLLIIIVQLQLGVDTEKVKHLETCWSR